MEWKPKNLLLSIFIVSMALGGSQTYAATNNPFPGWITKTALAVEIEPFATIPNSAGSYPRVNQFLPSPNGTLFAVDQRGPIYQVSEDGTSVSSYLNLATAPNVVLSISNEKGLQSVAFHPDFYNNGEVGFGKFYTIQSSSNRSPTPDFTPGGGGDSHDTVLLEWSTNSPSTIPFTVANAAAPFREVMRLQQPYSNHNAGLIAFNPSVKQDDPDYGLLYIAIGDGGSGGDPLNLSQNTTNPYGAILRINPIADDGDAYSIPADNPFVSDATKLDEIWAYGLRNPQRFSWDTEGRMFIADIGQGVIEEINLGIAGANYGWRAREGSHVYIDGGSVSDSDTRSDSPTTGYMYPIAEYDHDEGNAITAGYVYEGPVDSHLSGKFLLSDFPSGRIFFFDAEVLPDGGQEVLSELRLRNGGAEKSYLEIIRETNSGAGRADLRFGQGLDGTLYLFNKRDGIVSKILPLPRTVITATDFVGSIFTAKFTGEAGLTDWRIKGGNDLNNFPDDLTADGILTETTSGIYEVEIDLSETTSPYFIRIIRE